MRSNMELDFTKVEFYAIQWNRKLGFQKIKFHVRHISPNCIELNFGKIEFYFELDFEKVEFQKDAT